jgi:signal peptidase II
MPSAAERRIFFALALAVIAADLVTKFAAEGVLLRTAAIPVIGEWIQLRLVYNPGAAFGLFLGAYSRWIFLSIAVVAVVALERMSAAARTGDLPRQLALGSVAGGAFGNLLDRIRSPRGVVDFIDIGIGDVRWPTFNVADMAVTCGALLLAWSLWQEDAALAAEQKRAASAAAARPREPS